MRLPKNKIIEILTLESTENFIAELLILCAAAAGNAEEGEDEEDEEELLAADAALADKSS